MTTFAVQAKRWEHGWELYIDGIGVTQSHGLADAERMARSYLRMELGDAADDAVIEIRPELPGGLGKAAAAVRAKLRRIEADQARAAEESRSVARRLRAAGLSGADTATIMGISPQRVSQLTKR